MTLRSCVWCGVRYSSAEEGDGVVQHRPGCPVGGLGKKDRKKYEKAVKVKKGKIKGQRFEATIIDEVVDNVKLGVMDVDVIGGEDDEDEDEDA